MKRSNYTKGLHDLGNGVYAYLQPDGSWGWSNAGLIAEGEKSLLVDTLFDLALTQEMLNAMSEATKAATSIDILVITHANGDHCYGNQLVRGAEIIASKACCKTWIANGISFLLKLLLLFQLSVFGSRKRRSTVALIMVTWRPLMVAGFSQRAHETLPARILAMGCFAILFHLKPLI